MRGVGGKGFAQKRCSVVVDLEVAAKCQRCEEKGFLQAIFAWV
jgi:hypothetical protein